MPLHDLIPRFAWHRCATPALSLGLSVLVACSGDPSRSQPVQIRALPATEANLDERWPQPVDHVLDDGAEERNRELREAWLEAMHRAAPDVDWREIERQNGQREMARRFARLGEPDSQESSTPARWGEVGSRNQAGRMHCAMLGPEGPAGRKLYAGSSRGGLWRSDPDGSNWEPLGDNLHGGVHELLVFPGPAPLDPDVVLVVTGFGQVHVTRDEGATWEGPTGLDSSFQPRSLGRFTDGTLVLYGVGRPNPLFLVSVIYASTDQGQSFQRRWTGSANFAGSMWIPRVGAEAASTIYLVDQGKLLHSSDGGLQFTERSVISAGATRAVLTGSEAGSPHLYAALRVVSGEWKLFRSRSAGNLFTEVHTITDFWESLIALPTNQNAVFYGGVEVWRSRNQGTSFTRINGWGEYYGDPANKLHADIPGLFAWPDPADTTQSILYLCTDGGLYHSLDLGMTVHNLSLSGLGVSQYYSTLTSSRDPDLILAGAQDQGYQRGRYQPTTGSGPSTDFNQLISGDYGHLTSTGGTHDLVYCTYPGFILVQEGETNPQLHFLDFPSGASNLWLPPVVADPLAADTFYFLADQLWQYQRSGGSLWSQQVHSSQDFRVGGGSYLTALAFAPSDPNRAYAVNDAGILFYSSNGGVDWNVSANSSPGGHYFYGHALAVRPSDALEAFVGGSGYSTDGVYRTRDGGQTWRRMASGLPDTLVYDLAYSVDGVHVYAATEAGAFRWHRPTRTWLPIMEDGTPITTYWSVEAVADGSVMRFATYGRGIWDYTPCAQASWENFGAGLPGTFGIPGLTLGARPALGGDVVMSVENSSGAPAVGAVFVGFQQASLPLWGGTLLVQPSLLVSLPVPAAGVDLPFSIPYDEGACEVDVYLQVVQTDPGAVRGMSFTPGLHLTLGW